MSPTDLCSSPLYRVTTGKPLNPVPGSGGSNLRYEDEERLLEVVETRLETTDGLRPEVNRGLYHYLRCPLPGKGNVFGVNSQETDGFLFFLEEVGVYLGSS